MLLLSILNSQHHHSQKSLQVDALPFHSPSALGFPGLHITRGQSPDAWHSQKGLRACPVFAPVFVLVFVFLSS